MTRRVTMADWKPLDKKVVGQADGGPIITTLYKYIGSHPKVSFGSLTLWYGKAEGGYSLGVESPTFFPIMGETCWPTEDDHEACRIEHDLLATVDYSDRPDNFRVTVNVFCRPC